MITGSGSPCEAVTGSIEQEELKQVLVRVNPFSTQATAVLKGDLVKREISLISPMPTGLLDVLKLDQILDLLAYLQSGGNPNHTAFKP